MTWLLKLRQTVNDWHIWRDDLVLPDVWTVEWQQLVKLSTVVFAEVSCCTTITASYDIWDEAVVCAELTLVMYWLIYLCLY